MSSIIPERTLGGLEVFLPYVKDYIATYMGHSITTATWKNHLYAYFQKNGSEGQIEALNSIDWDVRTDNGYFMKATAEIVLQAWLHHSGLRLPVEMEYDLTLANPANELADRWYESRHTTDISKLDFKGSDLDSLDANQRGARRHVLLIVSVDQVRLQLSSSNDWRATMKLFLRVTFSISTSCTASPRPSAPKFDLDSIPWYSSHRQQCILFKEQQIGLLGRMTQASSKAA